MLRITNLFAQNLRKWASESSDTSAWIDAVYSAAVQVAAKRPPVWLDDHPLRGGYAEYRSFKPIRQNPDMMVIYLSRARDVVLADIGPHTQFFTKGRKSKARSPSRSLTRYR